MTESSGTNECICSACGAIIEADQKFCPNCGDEFDDFEVRTETAEADKQHVSGAELRSRSSVKPVFIGLAITALILASFVVIFVSQQTAQRRLAARTEASAVLSKIEECESAVYVGVTLDDLSKKASKARETALAFSRSEHGAMMPDFSRAAVKAAQDYADSCAAWFEDNEKATKKYDKAFDDWLKSPSGKPSPDLKDYKDDSTYQDIWSKAKDDLEAARIALQAESQ